MVRVPLPLYETENYPFLVLRSVKSFCARRYISIDLLKKVNKVYFSIGVHKCISELCHSLTNHTIFTHKTNPFDLFITLH